MNKNDKQPATPVAPSALLEKLVADVRAREDVSDPEWNLWARAVQIDLLA